MKTAVTEAKALVHTILLEAVSATYLATPLCSHHCSATLEYVKFHTKVLIKNEQRKSFHLFQYLRGRKVRGDHLPVLVSIFNQVFDIHDWFNQFFLCAFFCEKLHYNHKLRKRYHTKICCYPDHHAHPLHPWKTLTQSKTHPHTRMHRQILALPNFFTCLTNLSLSKRQSFTATAKLTFHIVIEMTSTRHHFHSAHVDL